MKVLVVGGAGYIGSHMVQMLLARGHASVVLDSLVTGYRDAVLGCELVEADLADAGALDALFSSHRFDAVMHFASFIQVGESDAHLIPLVLQAAFGRRSHIDIFGADYDTPDGTCIRDYIHVVDLCEAHLLALERLRQGAPSTAYNLGNGNGFSVQEVITAAERVTGTPIVRNIVARRAGDPARLVAEATLARTELGWRPRFDSLETIVRHAWEWERRLAGINTASRPA